MGSSSSPLSVLDAYRSPADTDPDSLGEFCTSRARYTVAGRRTYEIEIAFNHWTGWETYSVDQVVRCQSHNLWPWIRQRLVLEVPGSDDHDVLEFRCGFFPFRPLRVLLNGNTVVPNVFPRVLRNALLSSGIAGTLLGVAKCLWDFGGGWPFG